MAREQNILKKVDLPLLLMYFALAFMGLLTIYASSYDENFPAIYTWTKPYGKQLFWIFVSATIGGIILLMDSSLIKKSSYLVYGVVLLMLMVVYIYGFRRLAASCYIEGFSKWNMGHRVYFIDYFGSWSIILLFIILSVVN